MSPFISKLVLIPKKYTFKLPPFNYSRFLRSTFGIVALACLGSTVSKASVEDGDKAMAEGKYRVAIVQFEEQLKLNPEDGPTMIKAAEAYEAAKWWGRAVQWWDRFLVKFPTDSRTPNATAHAADCHRWLGANYYIIGGYYKMAIIELDKALALNPQLADAYIWLGTIYQNEGMYDETIAILDRGLLAVPNDEILQWLRKDAQNYRDTGGNAYIFHRKGIALYEKGSKTDALKMFRAAANASPDLAAAHLWMARILFEQRHYAESIPEWETAIRIRPDNDHAMFYLALAQSNVAEGK